MGSGISGTVSGDITGVMSGSISGTVSSDVLGAVSFTVSGATSGAILCVPSVNSCVWARWLSVAGSTSER